MRLQHAQSSVSYAFALVVVGLVSVSACASSVENHGDGGDVANTGDTGATDASSRDVASGDAFVCPADPSTLIGQPCSMLGQTCGHCSDPCQFCNLAYCDGAHWTMMEIFPGQCDGGTDVASIDAAGTVCGSNTCASGELCVHTISSGGPCIAPNDAGVCPDGTLPTGACCVFHSETWQCAARPTACNPTVTCGCAVSLCNGCSCQSASETQLDCGCFLP